MISSFYPFTSLSLFWRWLATSYDERKICHLHLFDREKKSHCCVSERMYAHKRNGNGIVDRFLGYWLLSELIENRILIDHFHVNWKHDFPEYDCIAEIRFASVWKVYKFISEHQKAYSANKICQKKETHFTGSHLLKRGCVWPRKLTNSKCNKLLLAVGVSLLHAALWRA